MTPGLYFLTGFIVGVWFGARVGASMAVRRVEALARGSDDTRPMVSEAEALAGSSAYPVARDFLESVLRWLDARGDPRRQTIVSHTGWDLVMLAKVAEEMRAEMSKPHAD